MSDECRGQSEVVGAVLLLGLTLLVTGVVVGVAVGPVGEGQQRAATTNAEDVMTLFDSRAALVALGRTDRQTVDLGNPGEGQYAVNDSAGWIRLRHLNYSGGGRTADVLNETLGTVTYTNGDTRIAYQGGGVWRSDGQGTPVLLSPPEFHYQSQTLTLPVVAVSDAPDARTGTRRATITPLAINRARYPNRSTFYPNGSHRYLNPISNGTVVLDVHSRYAEGWAEYFRDQSDGQVTVHPNGTVSLALATPGAQGQLSLSDGRIAMRGLSNGHALTDLNTTVAPGKRERFASLKWSLYAQSGSEEFEIAVPTQGGGQVKCDDGSPSQSTLPAWIYYSNGRTYESWSGNFSVQCVSGAPVLEMDATANRSFEYASDPTLNYFSTTGSFAGDVTFDAHDADGTTTFSEGDTNASRFLAQHYAALISDDGTLTLRTYDQSGSVSLRESSAYVRYETGGNVVTYIHATRNEVRVRLA
ncbi:hypothetical protein GCM10009037_02280 [Halarchaeum grantii]|uniref:DUF7308 domain-containing protein n=1 Tax=Halarchaeum grantii TaxID=1193105 RepID=A0A830ET64_9EURY|nr:hypothetical protein [Halarchaeum grantii]GGL22423.1 hypothetical protein GCM10009037_02280 [Halarchaeum grantii]